MNYSHLIRAPLVVGKALCNTIKIDSNCCNELQLSDKTKKNYRYNVSESFAFSMRKACIVIKAVKSGLQLQDKMGKSGDYC